MSKNPEKFGATSELVPVRAMLVEQSPGQGAILVMQDASFRMIIRTGAVDFDMKSPAEQSGLTYAFGSLVNSLEVDFPIQIVSHSKLLDTDAYIRQFEARLSNDRTPPKIKELISSHTKYFEEHVKTNKLLQRELYIVIPWKGDNKPLEKSFSDDVPFAGLLKAVSKSVEKNLLKHAPTDLEISEARQQLDLRADQIIARLEQMRVWGVRLGEEGVRQLLYEVYHPGLAERQRSPGLDTGGRLFGGFSQEALAPPGSQALPRRRRVSEESETNMLEPPSFS